MTQSTVDGLDNLQKCTLAAMQSEIDSLREELKKSGKVHILVLIVGDDPRSLYLLHVL